MSRKEAIVPKATVRYFGPGEHCSDPALGSLILVRHTGAMASIIRFGEWLRGKVQGQEPFWRVNHAMTVVSTVGAFIRVSEQEARGGTISDLATYVDHAYAVVTIDQSTTAARQESAKVGWWYSNVPYGWVSIASDTLYILSGIPLTLAIGQSVVCSTAAAQAQCAQGLIPDKPLVAVLPSDLARYFGVVIPSEMIT